MSQKLVTPKKRDRGSRAYSFTWNNYTEKDVDFLKNIEVQYIIFGKEVGESGTPHLQGYVYFHNTKTFSAVTKLFKGAHIEASAAHSADNRNYCIKDGDYFEKGTRPVSNAEKGQKESERWASALKASIDGNFDDIPPDIFLRYYSTIKRIRKEMGPRVVTCEIEESQFYPWQKKLKDELLGEPHSRRIIWYADGRGNRGKTEFAHYMARHFNAHIVANGKTSDIAYGLPEQPRMVLFDYTRSVEGHVNYAVLEAVKNGRIDSPKYESTVRYFAKPHVVVFANFGPDRTKLSEDRWDIRDLDNDEFN